jgi:hypothetical protein
MRHVLGNPRGFIRERDELHAILFIAQQHTRGRRESIAAIERHAANRMRGEVILVFTTE